MIAALSLPEHPMIRSFVLAVSLFAGAALASEASAQTAGEAVYASAAQLKALTAHPKDGLATPNAPTGPGTILLAARRDRQGLVELHLRQNDEFVVQAGHATVRVGGVVDGNHETGPGESRGGTSTGGHDYQLAPGDILWIPAGAPHQVTPKGGTFRYLAFKFEAAPAAR
jgi:mannose-6-phosphate isomerase-like protein (cupin superfamily)